MKIILVVDDEYDIISCLEMVLTMEGYEVHSAFQGKEALDALKSIPKPDLIISDVMMPLLDGYGFLNALKANPDYRDIPVILMSAAQLDETRLVPGSWTLFVRKPFDLSRLLVQIAAVLASRIGLKGGHEQTIPGA